MLNDADIHVNISPTTKPEGLPVAHTANQLIKAVGLNPVLQARNPALVFCPPTLKGLSCEGG